MQSTLPVKLNSSGGVVAVSASINYDTAALANPRVAISPASQAAGMTLTVNPNVSGRVGFLVDSASEYPAGSVDMVYITFDVIGAGSKPDLAAMNLTELAVTGSPTPLSASDPSGNSVSLGASSGLINTATGAPQAAVIGASTVTRVPPAPYVPPVDNTPKNATPTNTITKTPPAFLGGPTPASNPPVANNTSVVPNGLSATVSGLASNKLVLYGGIAAALWFVMKKK